MTNPPFNAAAASDPASAGTGTALPDPQADARSEVRRLCREFRAGLAAVRASIESSGASSDAVLTTTELFDGPMPAPLGRGAFADGVRMFGSRDELLRSVTLPASPTIAELGVWKGTFSRKLLQSLAPAACHLYDLDFSKLDPTVRSHPSVVLHEGDSSSLVAQLPDGSLDFAYVDGDHSYSGARRDLFAIEPKVKTGGFIQVNDYTPWSVLSGFPYGVMASLHELVREGNVQIVGFGLHPFGYHDVLLRKIR